MSQYYDPFRELSRAFNTAMRAPSSNAMPMDLTREGDHFIARIDLPGVDPESIDIDVEEGTLTIRADRRAAVHEDGVDWLVRERSTGTFARQLQLGNAVAPDRITADYADGVLTITIPVAEEAKPRKVAVTRSSKQHTVEGQIDEVREA